jgi:hypothetical protein
MDQDAPKYFLNLASSRTPGEINTNQPVAVIVAPATPLPFFDLAEISPSEQIKTGSRIAFAMDQDAPKYFLNQAS